MLRIIAIVLLLTGTATAQVMQPDQSLQEQLVPDSFKLQASATAAKISLAEWQTAISYALTNNSGMNLYMGIAMRSVAIGSCTEAYTARGGLQFLPVSALGAYSVDIQAGPPHAVFVPAGARVSGTILVDHCESPNPGSPTAPLSLVLLLGKTPTVRTMVQFPLSAVAPIRRVAPQF